MEFQDFEHDGAQFGFFRAVNHILIIFALPVKRIPLRVITHGVIGEGIAFFILVLVDLQVFLRPAGAVIQVGGHFDRVQIINGGEFFRFGQGCTGHAGQFVVFAEIILQGDSSVGNVFRLDLHAFLGFHGLVQAFRPAPSGHQAAGEFIHNDDLTVLDDVIFVFLVKQLCFERLFQVPQQARLFGGDVLRAVGIAQRNLQQILHVRFTDLGQCHAAVFFIEIVIFGGHLAHDGGHAVVPFHVLGSRPGDNQRGAGFVNEDVVPPRPRSRRHIHAVRGS